ncbi:MAG: hypothetical protein MUC95_00125 [Spirochaetes bacterium]|jgi:hypothetical protein|nr:hypothetical protein [Spirochaetota bacterium]
MIDLKKINVEYKAAAVFGAGSFALSVILSLLSGNTAGLIFFRSVIFSAVFCILGYASLYVMKRYVPEFYDIFSSGIFGSGTSDESSEMEKAVEAGGPDAGSEEVKTGDEENGSSAPEVKETIEAEADLGSIKDTLRRNAADKEYEKMFKYEPEIAAQAIRTMMKKDEK